MPTDFQVKALEALKAMVEEFRALDLPYGSKAYDNATDVLNEANMAKERKMTEIFLTQQLLAVAPFSALSDMNGQFRIKITSDKGETKWMNISKEQFRAVENALEDNL